jgi:hypothetical protein
METMVVEDGAGATNTKTMLCGSKTTVGERKLLKSPPLRRGIEPRNEARWGGLTSPPRLTAGFPVHYGAESQP